jgi:hypothetical protein
MLSLAHRGLVVPVTPSSFEVSCVRLGRTVSSISFSWNAAFVPPEAQAPQPDHNVHSGAPQSGVAHIICLGSEGVQGGAASQDTVECWAIRCFSSRKRDHIRLGVATTDLTMHRSALPLDLNDHIRGRAFDCGVPAPFASVP